MIFLSSYIFFIEGGPDISQSVWKGAPEKVSRLSGVALEIVLDHRHFLLHLPSNLNKRTGSLDKSPNTTGSPGITLPNCIERTNKTS